MWNVYHKEIYGVNPLFSQHKVTWPSERIVSHPYVFILLLVRRISALGNSFLRRVLEMVLHASGCRVDLRPHDFCFLSMFKLQIRKIFSRKPLGFITLCNEGFLFCVFRDKIGLLLLSLLSCSTPAHAQGNIADGAVDVFRHTKNTVTTGAIWLCS